MKSEKVKNPKPWEEVPGIFYVVLQELPPDQYKPFHDWLLGDTTPVVLLEEQRYNRAVYCAFYEDYERWYEGWVEDRISEKLD